MPLVATLERAPQRRRVFEFIRAEIGAGRAMPAPRAISDHMGWKNVDSATDCLNALAGLDGVLDRKRLSGRTEYSLKPEFR